MSREEDGEKSGEQKGIPSCPFLIGFSPQAGVTIRTEKTDGQPGQGCGADRDGGVQERLRENMTNQMEEIKTWGNHLPERLLSHISYRAI